MFHNQIKYDKNQINTGIIHLFCLFVFPKIKIFIIMRIPNDVGSSGNSKSLSINTQMTTLFVLCLNTLPTDMLVPNGRSKPPSLKITIALSIKNLTI